MWQALVAAARPVIRQIITQGIRQGATQGATQAGTQGNLWQTILGSVFPNGMPPPLSTVPWPGQPAPPGGGGGGGPGNRPPPAPGGAGQPGSWNPGGYNFPNPGQGGSNPNMPYPVQRAISSALTVGLYKLFSPGQSDGHTALVGSTNERVLKDQIATLNPVALAASVMSNPLDAIKRVTRATLDWGDALIEGSRHLSQWNGNLAAAYEREKRSQIARDIRSSYATGERTSSMIDELDELKDNLQPLKDLGTNLASTITEGMAHFLNKNIEIMQKDWGKNSELYMGITTGMGNMGLLLQSVRLLVNALQKVEALDRATNLNHMINKMKVNMNAASGPNFARNRRWP